MNKYLTKMLIVALVGMALCSGIVYAGGKLLGANVTVTDSSLSAYDDAQNPDIATNDSVIYAVWEDNRDSWSEEAEIYLAKSTDGGTTWGSNINVSNGLANEIGLDAPAVAMYPDGWVHVVWFNPYPGPGSECSGKTCVYMAASEDGTSFEAWDLWSSNDESYYIKPQLAIDPDSSDMLVAVSDYVGNGAGGENIYGLVWDYDAQKWRSQVINDQSGSAGSSAGVMDGSRMAVTARNNTSYIAWEDARGDNMRIYGDRTTDHGQSWGTDFAISPAGVEASEPRLVLMADGTLYAAYQVGKDVYVRRSTDNGSSWSTAVQATAVGEYLENYGWDLAVDANGTVAVVWSEASSGTGNLYLSTSIDDGQSFTTLGPIEDAQGDYPAVSGQYGPALVAYGSGDAARAIIVWEDDRNTHDEIWSARALLDATPPSAPSNLRATPGDTVVDLSWDEASDANGVAGYYVIRATTSGGPYQVLNSQIITPTSYRDVGLSTTTYYYKVYAVDTTGNIGPSSNEASAAATVGTDLPIAGTLAYEVGDDVRLNDLPNLESERTLAQGSWPVFAADGERIYYYSSQAILSRALDGSDPQTHYSHDELYGEFDIAHDNSDYFAWIEKEDYSQVDPYASWTVFEPYYGTSNDIQYKDTYDFAGSPTLSADRRWLAYTSLGFHAPHQLSDYGPVSLVIADLNAGKRVALHNDGHYYDPAFAPSGSTLAFAAAFSGQYEIWKATVGISGTLSNLMQLTRGATGEWSLAPAWSSDGNWLVFARGTPAGEADPEGPELQNSQLYVVQSDGSSLRALGISGEAPAWYGTGGAPPVTYDHFVRLPLIVRKR